MKIFWETSIGTCEGSCTFFRLQQCNVTNSIKPRENELLLPHFGNAVLVLQREVECFQPRHSPKNLHNRVERKKLR